MTLMETIASRNRRWILNNGRSYLGDGRVALLKTIKEHGSISAAARSMNMSYKKAWESIDVMNSLAEKPLAVWSSEGSGGGTRVTPAGVGAIGFFDSIHADCKAFLTDWVKTEVP